MQWTEFYDPAATRKHDHFDSWAGFANHLMSAPKHPTKAACPWFKLAVFGDDRTENGSLRHNANVRGITGIEGDYDGGQVTPEQAIEMLERHQIAGLVYTSPSHTPERPRWRVVCPLSGEHPPRDRERFLARLNGALGGILAPESFTLSQAFYYGRVRGTADDYAVLLTFDDPEEGHCIDELDDLDAIAVYRRANGSDRGAHPGTEERQSARRQAQGKVDKLGRKLQTGDGRRELLKAYVSSVSHRGLAGAELRHLVKQFIAEFFDPNDPVSERDVDGLAGWADRTTYEPPPETDGPPLWDDHDHPGEEAPDPADIFSAPPPPQLDLDASLPALLRDFAAMQAAAAGHDPGAYAYAAVAASSSVIAHSVRVEIARTWQEPILLWAALLGGSGVGKSPAMDAAAAPVLAMHLRLAEQYETEADVWKASDSKDDPPVQDHRHVSNCTIEALMDRASRCDHQILRHADEGTSWLNAMGRYVTAGGDSERGDWLSAWQGKPYTHSRINRGDRALDAWGISVLFGIVPQKMAAGYEEAASDGLLARTLCYVLSRDRCGEADYDLDPSAAAMEYGRHVEILARIRNATYTLTAPAADIWRERQRYYRSAIGEVEEVSLGLASFMAKIPAMQARVAGLFHLFEGKGNLIGAETMRQAEAFMDHAFAMARHVHLHLFATRNEVTDSARKCASRILTAGAERITRRELLQAGAISSKDHRTAAAAINYLFAMGWLLRADTKRIRLGPRPEDATAWIVNSRVHDRFIDVAENQRERAKKVRTILSPCG